MSKTPRQAWQSWQSPRLPSAKSTRESDGAKHIAAKQRINKRSACKQGRRNIVPLPHDVNDSGSEAIHIVKCFRTSSAKALDGGLCW